MEARVHGDADGQRPAEQAGADETGERIDGGAEAVEAAVEAEPRVQTEDTAVAADGVGDGLAFGDGARHGLFGPDVAASVQCVNILEGVPMRRRDDVDDVDLLAVDHFTEVKICFAVVAGLSGAGGLRFAAGFADIADGDKPGLRIVENVADMAAAHAADADDGVVDLVIGAAAARPRKNAARNDGEARAGCGAGRQKISSVHFRHVLPLVVGCPI